MDFSILESGFLPSKISTTLSKEFDDIEYVGNNLPKILANNQKMKRLLTKINSISFKKECQKLAKKHFSLKKANSKYLSIYGKVTNK